MVGVLLVLVVAMAIAFNRGRQDGEAPDGLGTVPETLELRTRPRAHPSSWPASRDFDPEADPPEENPDEAPNAIDGDAATSWTTSTYRGDPALGGLKPGVGLMVDLGKDQEVRR